MKYFVLVNIRKSSGVSIRTEQLFKTKWEAESVCDYANKNLGYGYLNAETAEDSNLYYTIEAKNSKFFTKPSAAKVGKENRISEKHYEVQHN